MPWWMCMWTEPPVPLKGAWQQVLQGKTVLYFLDFFVLSGGTTIKLVLRRTFVRSVILCSRILNHRGTKLHEASLCVPWCLRRPKKMVNELVSIFAF
jgi:hypothetical protein